MRVGSQGLACRDPLLKRSWAMIAGGGTAGHVLPGIALARALVERGHGVEEIHWVGSRRGLEARLVPEAGFSVTLLAGRGIPRRLSLESLGAVWQLVGSTAVALAVILRRRPSVVVALGGYASVPCALAAGTLRVPVVVLEQNAVPGAANRLISRFARVSATSFEGTALRRARLTGNPVRAEILSVDRTSQRRQARSELGVDPGRHLVAVFGGSLGAARINRAVVDSLPWWAARSDLAIHHVVGERDWIEMSESLPELAPGALSYRPVRYEERMDLLLAAADLVVCRAGATSVAELAAVGIPSVLIPLPGAPGDHQTANARALARVGGAIIVADKELDGGRLTAVVDGLLADPVRLRAMGLAAASVGRRDAAEAVASLVEATAR